MNAMTHTAAKSFNAFCVAVFAAALIALPANAAETNAAEKVVLEPVITSDIYTTRTNLIGNLGYDFGFTVGEELYYKIYWGWIPVGKSRIITRWVEKDGKNYLAFRYRTRSNSVINKIYRVDDSIESIVDPDTFLPIIFTKNLNEGRHRYYEQTTFDFEKKAAHWRSFNKQREKTYDIEDDSRDLLCFLFYMRNLKIEPEKLKKVKVMADEKLYDLEIQAHKVEKVGTKGFGDVSGLKVEPKAKFQGLFVRKGKMMIWLSDDERAVAVRVEVQIPLAKVKVLLHEVTGPGDDFWIKRTIENRKKGEKDEADEAEVDAALRELDDK